MRTNSGSMRDNSPLSVSTVNNNDAEKGTKSPENGQSFKRGGYLRSTAGARLQYDSNNKTATSNSNSFIK